jgi:hypothetical protein
MQKKQFNQLLIARAKEQQKLSSSQVLPVWFGPFTRLIAFHAMQSIVCFSFLVSLLLFSVYFKWFMTLGALLR